MELISILSISLALIPIIYVLWVSRKSIVTYFRTLKKRGLVASVNDNHNFSGYEKIQQSVSSLENATQPNQGTHHPESVYLDRANRIRRETKFYNHINSLN